jgi:VWFA-related protein
LLACALIPLPVPAQPELVLRSTTRLIQVEVIVRDKAGKPVRGLKQSDFEVFEDGKRQDIRFFSGGAEKAQAAVELPAGMVSNRVMDTGARRGVTAILIDSLNTDWRFLSKADESLTRLLASLRPDDRIALYTLGSRFRVVHEFSTDAASLLARLKTRSTAPLPDTGQQRELRFMGDSSSRNAAVSVGALLEATSRVEDDFRAAQRATTTFSTLEGVARHLGATPGWKSLIWISDGFPLTLGQEPSVRNRGRTDVYTGPRGTLAAELQHAVRELSNANVAVYPVDPQGLMGLSENEWMGWDKGPVRRPWQTEHSVLHQLAEATGGRAYTQQNDILGALRQVSDNAQAGYTLAYHTRNADFDGRFRSIQVKLRAAGLTAFHRKGYYALDLDAMKHV